MSTSESGDFYATSTGGQIFHIVGKTWRQKLFAGDSYGYHDVCGTDHWHFEPCPGYGTAKIGEVPR